MQKKHPAPDAAKNLKNRPKTKLKAKPGQPAQPTEKKGPHPRNRHLGRYDFPQLIACRPELATFVAPNAYGDDSIDFANPEAVRALNGALLKLQYGIDGWNIPARYLCPPIPGRADYLHYLADLLARSNGGVVPHGTAIRVLDIGVGANCIYPLIGHSEYGWSFVGTDIDRAALASAQATLDANASHRFAIELRRQTSREDIFKGVVHHDELFDLTLCNPPFHSSLDEARAGSERKWKNLGKEAPSSKPPTLNFGGQNSELCCPGGEAGFVSRMIAESVHVQNNCLWFSALVSKATSLPAIYRALKQAGVRKNLTIEMSQGQKKSRIVAWTFLAERQQQAWRNQNRGD
ncbi:23S rRNA (adenine(1618)-N(6))-methyltransferase RlmF [Propionivibrio limicola]|uniref:23S rRNA (adenine(1618)-N(6))-methyltransferase RlmF n=1 Tax=Propionivibrio limicola TaxID=167645 RepID=UPI0012908CF0|nr:23S rRNA (adenine(1618)-N(6))-methyltransferase RlmF [Propionivibrio limicola]